MTLFAKSAWTSLVLSLFALAQALAGNPFTEVDPTRVKKVVIGKWESLRNEAGELTDKQEFKPLHEITDAPEVASLAAEVSKAQAVPTILEPDGVNPVLFLDEAGGVLMAVTFFPVSRPAGGCLPITIVAKDGKLLLGDPIGDWDASLALSCPTFNTQVGWKYNGD